jgi:hypothetical protein
VTGSEGQPRSVVDAVADAAIADLLPADPRLSITAAEHRDRGDASGSVTSSVSSYRASHSSGVRYPSVECNRSVL